uniref:Uncharacterized protein n=1 Tax=Anguilla anguilla TaxID=7936 RepID=A0A0E9UXX5_ANGAN
MKLGEYVDLLTWHCLVKWDQSAIRRHYSKYTGFQRVSLAVVNAKSNYLH